MFKRLLFCLVILILLIACEESADIVNSKLYDQYDMRFQYPGNWTVSDIETTGLYQNLFIESPGNALMVIQSVDHSVEKDLMDYAQSFSQMAAESINIGSAGQSTFSQDEKAVSERVDITLLTEAIPHVRKYIKVKGKSKSYFLISQSSEDDLEKTSAGFNLIFSSFKAL